MSTPYTVVIPAFNAALFVGAALNSVLVQTRPPGRIIVVDDGSTDDTAAAVKAIAGPIEYVRQENMGPGAATTHGLNMVRTDLVATCDADDLWLPDKIERQSAVLDAEPSVAGVFGQLADFRSEADKANRDRPYDGWSRTTMLIRTEVARSIGAIIDPKGKVGDMVDWLARVREGGHRLVMMPEIVALRRVHENSMTYHDRGGLSRAYLEVVRAAMERRRRSQSS